MLMLLDEIYIDGLTQYKSFFSGDIAYNYI